MQNYGRVLPIRSTGGVVAGRGETGRTPSPAPAAWPPKSLAAPRHPRKTVHLILLESEAGKGCCGDVVGSWGFYSNKQLLHLMFHILHCPHFPPPFPPVLCIFNCSNVSRHSVSFLLKQRRPATARGMHSAGERGRRNQGYYVNAPCGGGGTCATSVLHV